MFSLLRVIYELYYENTHLAAFESELRKVIEAYSMFYNEDTVGRAGDPGTLEIHGPGVYYGVKKYAKKYPRKYAKKYSKKYLRKYYKKYPRKSCLRR
jgi:hypothetical protein